MDSLLIYGPQDAAALVRSLLMLGRKFSRRFKCVIAMDINVKSVKKPYRCT